MTQSTVGALLVNREKLKGATQAEAEVLVLEMIASKLATAAAAILAKAGDNGTSVTQLIPDPVTVDPSAETGDAIEIDARVKAWTRPGTEEAFESLVFEFRTFDGIPDEALLPDSVLALREQEEVGFSRAGWAILRSLRRSQRKSLCLDDADFDTDPAEPCRLTRSRNIKINNDDATVTKFRASIQHSTEAGEDLLHVEGRAEGGTWWYDWWMEFELAYRLGRGEVQRDPLPGEQQLRRDTDQGPPRRIGRDEVRGHR